MPKQTKLDIKPLKLIPPPQVAMRMMEQDKIRPSGNKVIRWIKTFLGEGF